MRVILIFQNAGPEVMWIDSQKPIFSFSLHMNSTVLTKDSHLHNLFTHAEKLLETKPVAGASDSETCRILNAAHSIQLMTAITFFPTIVNELFTLLTCNISYEVGQSIVRLLLHILTLIQESGRKEISQAYIKVSTICFPQ